MIVRAVLAAIAAALLTLVIPAAAGAAEEAPAEVVDLPVTFSVENVNRSRVPCPTDGGTYEIAGHLVAPAAALEGGAQAVTLYLHGLGYGEFFWRFRAVPGYDYATAQAQAGHVSVVIDRLGYDSSGRPVGQDVCIGAHADIAHQVVTALRSGEYELDGAAGAAFERVALAGHSLGTQIAQVAAYSFGDIDALVTSAYTSEGSTQRAMQESFRSGSACAMSGGDPPDDAADAGPSGYAYFGRRPEDFQAAMFHDADPAVVAAATGLRNRDPCGDFSTLLPAILLNRVWLREATVPVLIVCAGEDALFEADRCMQQEDLYASSPDITSVLVPDAGHGLTLERAKDEFRAVLSGWLGERGF